MKYGLVCTGIAATLLLGMSMAAANTTYDFEDLGFGTTYYPTDIIHTGGADFLCSDFQWSNTIWTNGGRATVDNQQLAGGSGLDLNLNNINVGTVFSSPMTEVSLLLGDYGGNCNLEVNGDFINFGYFDDIHGTTLGGCSISVVNGGYNEQGGVTISGSIDSFKVGGQEFWIDEITCVPEPTTMTLLGLAGATLLRRRKA